MFSRRLTWKSWTNLASIALCALLLCPALLGQDLARQRALELERLYLIEGPSLALSTVYEQIPAPQRVALLEKLKSMVLAQLPPDLLDNPALEGLPTPVKSALAKLLPFLKAASPQQLEAVVSKMDLDHLAPIPPAAFRIYHERALSEPAAAGGAKRAALLESDRQNPAAWTAQVTATPGYECEGEPPPAELEILEPTADPPRAEVPANHVEPSSIAPLVHSHVYVKLAPAVLANSARLARALNHLTRPEYRTRPMLLRAAGSTRQVRDGVELINSLLATGRYDVAAFDARMFVDFLGYSIPVGGKPLPVRIPTWTFTGLSPAQPTAASGERGTGAVPPSSTDAVRPQGEPAGAGGPGLLMPLNHSEHLLVFFDKGTTAPAMLVKWYMGIPGGAMQQGTFWRPAIQMRTSWCGYRLVRVYPGPESARQLVRSAGLLMQLYNYLQARFQARANGYGLYGVCQDTTGIMEVILGLAGGHTSVWPLARDPRFDHYYGAILGPVGLRLASSSAAMPLLDVPSDSRPDLYLWISDQKVHLYRIGANVPTRDPASLHFPELRQPVELLRDRHESFRRGLALQQ